MDRSKEAERGCWIRYPSGDSGYATARTLDIIDQRAQRTKHATGGLRPMQTAYITHRDCLLHDMGRHHPECPERLNAITDALIASGVLACLFEHDAPPATR